jgi:hypothetical protein
LYIILVSSTDAVLHIKAKRETDPWRALATSGNTHFLQGKGVSLVVFVLTTGYLETQEQPIARRAFSGTTGSTLEKPIKGLSYSSLVPSRFG